MSASLEVFESILLNSHTQPHQKEFPANPHVILLPLYAQTHRLSLSLILQLRGNCRGNTMLLTRVKASQSVSSKAVFPL